MEECFVCERHGVRVARAVANVGRPSLNGSSNLSFVAFDCSFTKTCRTGIGIVRVGRTKTRTCRDYSTIDSGGMLSNWGDLPKLVATATNKTRARMPREDIWLVVAEVARQEVWKTRQY